MLIKNRFLSFYPKQVNQNERIIISLDAMAQILGNIIIMK
jgi:hypothetical protein